MNEKKQTNSFIVKAAGLILLVLILLIVISRLLLMNRTTEAEEPGIQVTAISASNDKEYDVTDELLPEDFLVCAELSNGKQKTLSPETYTLSRTTLEPTGNITSVTVNYLAEEETVPLTCEVSLTVKREKICSFPCGYPIETNVEAVLYSNGELCFEGKGDTLQFSRGNFPWMRYEMRDQYPIYSVTFSPDVKPMKMDEWFRGMSSIHYIGKLPSSVVSMEYTFADCDGLTAGADWSNCRLLLDITGIYENCTWLTEVPPVPASVRNGDYAFADCTSLMAATELSQALCLETAQGMFQNCSKLTSVSMAPNLQNMNEMYQYCINIQKMPEIPGSVLTMESSFYGDVSLTDTTTIPFRVENIQNCFAGCTHLNGKLKLQAEPDSYAGFLNGAAVATRLDLTGSCSFLNTLGLEAQNPNVTVNGNLPKLILQEPQEPISMQREGQETAESTSMQAEQQKIQESTQSQTERTELTEESEPPQ